MVKKAIGLVIKELVDQKNIPIPDLMEAVGVSRQSIYNAFSRVTMKDAELEKWASVLKVSKEELRRLSEEGEISPESKLFGEETIQRLEEHFKSEVDYLRKQLDKKDELIDRLQGTVDKLLGKSKGAPIRPLRRGKVIFFTPVRPIRNLVAK